MSRKSDAMNSPKPSEIENMSDAELLSKSMTGFSEVIWYVLSLSKVSNHF